jgi:hypothetical protein
VVADLLGTGENAGNWQHLMLLETARHRLLGHQVAQVLAVSRFVAGTGTAPRVQLVTEGQVAAVVGLLAAAPEPRQFSVLTAHGSIASLVHLLEGAERYETSQPLFCFGLLEVADLAQIQALLEEVVYEQPQRAVPATMAAGLAPARPPA